MTRSSFTSFCLAGGLFVVAATVLTPGAHAQSRAPRRVVTPDSIYARAKQLVVNGNGAAGRVLVDSMMAAAAPNTPAYADALYWRASLSTSIRDAERDLRTIIVEYPLSPRSSDALLQLGQLEAAGGDRAAAAAHLDRFLAENPNSPEQGRAGLLLVRVSFEANDAKRGCIGLARALNAVPADAVELRNQLQYYSPRCVGVDTTNAPKAAPAPAAPAKGAKTKTAATKSTSAKPSAPDTTRGKTKAKPTKTSKTTKPGPDTAVAADGGASAPETDVKNPFTLQVAAYTSRTDASALVAKLKKRSIDARVDPAGKLFRVRIGHYATHDAAAAAAAALKARKIDVFVSDTRKDVKK